jgi:tetratricopeptide (TPR) repeat protein
MNPPPLSPPLSPPSPSSHTRTPLRPSLHIIVTRSRIRDHVDVDIELSGALATAEPHCGAPPSFSLALYAHLPGIALASTMSFDPGELALEQAAWNKEELGIARSNAYMGPRIARQLGLNDSSWVLYNLAVSRSRYHFHNNEHHHRRHSSPPQPLPPKPQTATTITTTTYTPTPPTATSRFTPRPACASHLAQHALHTSPSMRFTPRPACVLRLEAMSTTLHRLHFPSWVGNVLVRVLRCLSSAPTGGRENTHTHTHTFALSQAVYWRVRGDGGEAVKCLQLALVTSPNAVKDTALLQLANILANVGALADALTLVNRAAAVARPSHALHYLRGRLLLDVGDDAGALEAFEQAVEAQPELMAAHVMRRDLTHRVKGLAAPTRRQYEIDLRKITMVLPFNLTWEDYEYEVCGSILSSSSHCSPLLLFLLSAHHSLSFSLLSPLLSLYARLIFFVLDLLLLYSRALSRNDSFITRCPRARARAHAHAHSHAHTHTHTRTLARTRTHTHTHTFVALRLSSTRAKA